MSQDINIRNRSLLLLCIDIESAPTLTLPQLKKTETILIVIFCSHCLALPISFVKLATLLPERQKAAR